MLAINELFVNTDELFNILNGLLCSGRHAVVASNTYRNSGGYPFDTELGKALEDEDYIHHPNGNTNSGSGKANDITNIFYEFDREHIGDAK